MRRRLVIVLALLVLVPVGLLAWVGVWAVTGERARVRESIQELQAEQLRQVESTLIDAVKRIEQELRKVQATARPDAASLREMIRSRAIVRQALLLDAEGRVLHPPPGAPLTNDEEVFLRRAEQVFLDRSLFVRARGAGNDERTVRDNGWYHWYHGGGVNHLLWFRLSNGRVLGIEINRFRLMADLIATLPAETPDRPQSAGQRIVLLNSLGEVIHQWGGHEPERGEQPAARRQLGAPLRAWTLVMYAGPAGASGAGIWIVLLAGLALATVALGGLATYLYRASGRELREAEQRVSFVNHVSHELKTPLTNIRMYAELLAEELADADDKAVRHADVVAAESQRLSRLIDNVLTFGRQQRGALRIRKQKAVVDRVIDDVLKVFRPLLVRRGVEVVLQGDAGSPVLLDPDVLGQIVANLLGNVEKYAAAGGRVEIASAQAGGRITIRVADRGPGVPPAERERIFEPFVRLGDAPTEGASGTGIGLTISRELARLHGGDLVLEPSPTGAVFRLELAVGVEEEG